METQWKIRRIETNVFRLYTMDTAVLDNESAYRAGCQLLSRERWKTLCRLRHPDARKRSLAASILLDTGLRAAGLQLSTARIVRNEYGKPILLNRPEIHFNLSHSGQMAMAAFSHLPVGCDIERLRTFPSGFAERFFTTEECDWLSHQPDRVSALTRLWTLKESFVKAIGLGLHLSLKQFSISVDSESISVVQSISEHQFRFREYVFGKYCAAVCMEYMTIG